MLRPLSICSTPDCPRLTDRAGRCRACRRDTDARRPNSTQRGYDNRWARTRALFIADHPVCEQAGCTELATDVHHRDGLGPLGPRGHDAANLQALCHRHHSSLTMLLQRAARVGG